MKILLYFHTLKFLTFKQICFQVIYRIYRPSIKWVQFIPTLKIQQSNLIPAPPKRDSLLTSNEFVFFEKKGNLEIVGWNGNERSKLWRYNQHYFDHLNALDAGSKQDWHLSLLDHWIDQNKSPTSIGWDPYPTSLRIVNWVKWDLAYKGLSAERHQNLYSQGLFLESRLEHHISGNHLIANAKALIFLSFYFDGLDSIRWFKKGFAILSDEIEDQILADGGNYERSPMYHCIFLEDLLDLINFSKITLSADADKVIELLSPFIQPMLFWMNVMTHPNGNIPCFNDSANNVTTSPELLRSFADRLGFESNVAGESYGLDYNYLKDSGYVAVYNDSLQMILDIGRLGPDKLLAHAHADTLSFELAEGDECIFVNSGTSTYEPTPQRIFERSTRAHNTLEIDDVSSSQVWSSFRVAKRAVPFNIDVQKNRDSILVQASHDGYKTLRGSPIHSRAWNVKQDNITITDNLDSPMHSATARYILHASMRIHQISDNEVRIVTPKKIELIFHVLTGFLKICDWQHTDNLGSLQDTYCLEIAALDGTCVVELMR